MQQPISFEVCRARKRRLVCRLNKGLYGLKQSVRVWNQKFDQFLQAYDLIVFDADYCVYVNKEDPKLILCIWIDYGIVCSTFNDSIQKIIDCMEGAFQITKGLAKVNIGLHITKDRDQGLIHLDQ